MHGGVRMSWADLPASIVTAVDDLCSSPVVAAVDQTGGFSPGVAARCTLRNGQKVFVKAVSATQNPISPSFHRREIEVHRHLPESAPIARLLWSHDDGEWVVLVLEDVEGTNPTLPWSLADLGAVFDALDALDAAVDPSALLGLPEVTSHLADQFSFWRRLAAGDPLGERLDTATHHRIIELAELEACWADAASGDQLLHADLRSDNLILRPDGRIVIVDWPGASRGSAWVDRLFMLPSVGLDGGPPPEEVVDEVDPFSGVAPDEVDAVLAALCGLFVVGGVQDPPPGLPTVRAFQRAQGEVAMGWLARRRGWDR